jgi:hypothetical protein
MAIEFYLRAGGDAVRKNEEGPFALAFSQPLALIGSAIENVPGLSLQNATRNLLFCTVDRGFLGCFSDNPIESPAALGLPFLNLCPGVFQCDRAIEDKFARSGIFVRTEVA